MNITLRPVTDADLPLYAGWLQMPHVAKWYRDPEDWLTEFKNRRAEYSFIRHFIAMADGVPFGFCQYYACRDSGEDWNGYAAPDDAYSIDYLIGEAAYLRRGCGRQMVAALLNMLKAHPDAKRVIVQPERENEASRGLLLACGFHYDVEKDIFVKLLQN